MRAADLTRLQAKGWRVTPLGDGRLFETTGPTMAGMSLTCITEATAWRVALDLERWEGMELRAPKQLDLFAEAAAA